MFYVLILKRHLFILTGIFLFIGPPILRELGRGENDVKDSLV